MASSSKASRLPKNPCGQFSRSGRRFEPLCLRVSLKLLRSNQPSGRNDWSRFLNTIKKDLDQLVQK